MNYLTLFTRIGFWGIIESINLKDNKIYPFLADLSTTMYLLHMYIWSFYYKIAYGGKCYGVDSFIVTLLFTIVISVMYVIIKHRIAEAMNNRYNYLYKK